MISYCIVQYYFIHSHAKSFLFALSLWRRWHGDRGAHIFTLLVRKKIYFPISKLFEEDGSIAAFLLLGRWCSTNFTAILRHAIQVSDVVVAGKLVRITIGNGRGDCLVTMLMMAK